VLEGLDPARHVAANPERVMLMHDLGFRPPRRDEEARILTMRASGELPDAPTPGPTFRIPAALLSGNPLISYSGIVPPAPLGLASLGAAPLPGRPAWFLLSPTWSIAEDATAETLRARAVLHRLDHPDHRLIFIGNTPEEARLLQAHGEAAFFYNKTANTAERVFRPLNGVRADFDAIYNAQLVPWKRHELSLGIANCAFLFYRDHAEPSAVPMAAAIMARHAAVPGHVFINALDDAQQPVRLTPSDVNRHLNRARIGLCLSAREGAMFASTEYLLAGLPIVTTPSTGGRHVYHDEEYCWTVAADPDFVAGAVQALKAQGIPRAHVRDRTLRRLESDRSRFLALLNAILEESGSPRRLGAPWPLRKAVTMEWLPSAEAVRRAVDGVVDAYDERNRASLLRRAGRRALRLKRRYLG
jgi:hypothetical protein